MSCTTSVTPSADPHLSRRPEMSNAPHIQENFNSRLGHHRPHQFQMLLLLLFAALTAGQRTCFSPSGANLSSIAGHTPCLSSASVSHCCTAHDLCLSNGYCYSQGSYYANRVYRGGCTDPSFPGPCPRQCADVNTESTCPVALLKDTQEGGFCCVYGEQWTNGTTCLQETGGSTIPFEMQEGWIIVDRETGATLNQTQDTVCNITGSQVNTPSRAGEGRRLNKVALGIGLGVALPLFIGLVAMGFWVAAERKQRRVAEMRLNASGARMDTHPVHSSRRMPESSVSASASGSHWTPMEGPRSELAEEREAKELHG